jgi:hypothetical protein
LASNSPGITPDPFTNSIATKIIQKISGF